MTNDVVIQSFTGAKFCTCKLLYLAVIRLIRYHKKRSAVLINYTTEYSGKTDPSETKRTYNTKKQQDRSY